MLSAAPAATFFHTAEWARLWEESFPFFKSYFLVEFGSDGGYCAGLPFVAAKKLLTGYYSMPMGTYGGAVSRSGGTAFHLYGRWLDETAALTRDRLVVSSPVAIPGLTGLGFAERRLVTHSVERPDAGWTEKIWPARTRTKMRHLKVSPLVVRSAQGLSDVREAFRLAGRRARKRFYSEKFFRGLLESVGPTGRLLWLLAFLENEMAGFQIYFEFKREFFYWDGGFERRFGAHNPGYVLFRRAFEEARAKNLARINLGSTPVGATGVDFFKKQLGGQKLTVWEYTAASPLKRRLRAAYQKVRGRI